MDSLEFLDDVTVARLLLTNSGNTDIRVETDRDLRARTGSARPAERRPEDAIQTGTPWLDSDGRAAGALARLSVARLRLTRSQRRDGGCLDGSAELRDAEHRRRLEGR